ncbi:MAG: hypothetical protein M0Z41_16675 [Peptococcaceae bacterium]|nr:hypothetical protein [Peptococcaceae bacterium]
MKRFKPETKHGQTELVNGINRINSQIRGIVQYYEAATWGNMILQKHSKTVAYAAYKALKRHGVTWTQANMVNNLISVYTNYETSIPAVEYTGLKIGITSLQFCKR